MNSRFSGTDDIMTTIGSGRGRNDDESNLPTFSIRT